MRTLIVVDVQNDFVNGSLGSEKSTGDYSECEKEN